MSLLGFPNRQRVQHWGWGYKKSLLDLNRSILHKKTEFEI